VTCRKGDELWNKPDALEPEIRTSLTRVGVIREEKAILGCAVERIPNTYPVYTLDYRKKQEQAFQLIGSYKNVKLLGRTGSFWYNNMDHSIQAAMKLCDDIKQIGH
jgi:protoporphyrinogen oxidase